MSKEKILVSGCLLGEKCAYDAFSRLNEDVAELSSVFDCVSVCPEILGGLGCPRQMHEIAGGTGEDVLRGTAVVKSISGKDRTQEFIRGAELTLSKAETLGIKAAIMKSHSPSCGKYNVYSGYFDKKLKPGSGVTTALLEQNAVKVFTEKEVPELISGLKNTRHML